MVLVSNQQWKFDVDSFHDLVSTILILLLQLDLPVSHDALHEEIQTDEEINDFIFIIFEIM